MTSRINCRAQIEFPHLGKIPTSRNAHFGEYPTWRMPTSADAHLGKMANSMKVQLDGRMPTLTRSPLWILNANICKYPFKRKPKFNESYHQGTISLKAWLRRNSLSLRTKSQRHKFANSGPPVASWHEFASYLITPIHQLIYFTNHHHCNLGAPLKSSQLAIYEHCQEKSTSRQVPSGQ